MMKTMLSQPMAGKTDKEIVATRENERTRSGSDSFMFSC